MYVKEVFIITTICPSTQKYDEDLNNLFYMVDELLYGVGVSKIEKDDFELLIKSFDYVIRASGMYNDMVKQEIGKGKIVTADPQGYIGSNIDTAVVLTKKIHDKYKYLSRYGK